MDDLPKDTLDTLETPDTAQNKKPKVTPMKKLFSFKVVLVFVFAILLSPFVMPTYRFFRAAFAWEQIEKATLSVLKSDNLSFLVTDRIVSQIAVEISNNSPLLGKREGILIATVTMYYGVDLQQLDNSSLSREENTLVITIPQPSELDFSVDLNSIKYITKRSGLNTLADFFSSNDMKEELRQGIHQQALTFMTEQKMIPTRSKIVTQLTELARPFSTELGVEIEFR